MQLSPFVEGAEPTPPLGHPRQLVGCPGGEVQPFPYFVSTCMLMNRYFVMYLSQTNLVPYCLFD